MSPEEWGFWIAVAALVAGAGKFLDDYHIEAETKSKARELLVRWFNWLEGISVPDLGATLLRPVKSILAYRIFAVIFFLLGSYIAVTTIFYFWRRVHGPDPSSYVRYVMEWLSGSNQLYWALFMTVILAAALAGSWVMVVLVIRATQATSSWRRALLLTSAALLGPLTSLVGAVLLTVATGTMQPYGQGLYRASMLSPALPLAFVLLVLLLMTFRALIRVMQWVLIDVFKSASKPSSSPFGYASALLGVTIVGAKVVQSAL